MKANTKTKLPTGASEDKLDFGIDSGIHNDLSRLNKRWTKKEDADLRRLAGNYPVETIAGKLGRTASSVQQRASNLGIGLRVKRTIGIKPRQKKLNSGVVASGFKGMSSIYMEVRRKKSN